MTLCVLCASGILLCADEVFSHPDKEMEFLYKQLKVQLEEKCKAFDSLRDELLQAENKIALLQKEHEENPVLDQIKALQEEKQRLETEVVSCQELITKLSTKKKRSQKPPVSARKV